MPSSETQPASLHRPMLAAIVAAALGVTSTLAPAQITPLPLPPNYRTTLENADVLVMKVHYGAHEFVPLHDHSAYPTVYLYLNDSGEVQLKHEGADGFVATRPPTHTGAWRISPGMAERHSVQSLSDTPSDFLRIELKSIAPDAVKKVVRGEAPPASFIGSKTDLQQPALQVDRAVCPPARSCTLAASANRGVLAAIVPMHVKIMGHDRALQAGDVVWLPADAGAVDLSPGAQCLRVSLLYPAT